MFFLVIIILFIYLSISCCVSDFQGAHHEDPWATYHSNNLRIWKYCLFWSQQVCLPVSLYSSSVTLRLQDSFQDSIRAPFTSLCLSSEDQSRVATRRYARIVQRLGFPVSFLNFKIQNLVATCSTFPVSLERLMLAHHQHCRSGHCCWVHMSLPSERIWIRIIRY